MFKKLKRRNTEIDELNNIIIKLMLINVSTS